MTSNSIHKQNTIAITTCCIYLFLTIFYHHIDKYLTGVIFIILSLLIPITFITVLIYFIKGLIQIFRNGHSLTFKFWLPTIICLVTLTYTIFSPYRLDSENLESKIILRACFEGTQNQATIKFRENKTFEINWTGAFLADRWYTGMYKQKNDTFYLNYTTEKPYRFGDTILNNGKSLIILNKFKIDSSQYFVPFYLGYCKGLN